MSNRVTLKDVAARAGVSLTTVSLFLNGNAAVCSSETAERIRSAVADLNYVIRPRAAAVAAARLAAGEGVPTGGSTAGTVAVLEPAASWGAAGAAGSRAGAPRTTRSRNIGIVFSPDQDLLAPAEPVGASSFRSDRIWRGAAQEAEAEEFGLLSYPSRVRNGSASEPFLDGAAAGVILASDGGRDERAERLASAGLPVVLLGRFLDIPDGCGAVYAYERDTVDLAMGHLESLGHRRIAHFAGPVAGTVSLETTEDEGAGGTPPAASDVALTRLDRYERWMRSHGAYDAALVRASREWGADPDAAADAVDAWLSLPEPPTAVFCASAALAASLIAAARQRGLAVPGDLSVVGVGESDDEAITTVAMPDEQIGREAVRLLLRIVDGVSPASCRLALPVTQLIIGGSTAAAPSTATQLGMVAAGAA